MIILGFESSCDDTGVAIFSESEGVVVNLINNQYLIHKDYGGVVPELASRDHLNKISLLTKRALDKASLTLSNIDAVAYTLGPGLTGSLLIGSSFAQTISWSMNIPAVPIHHLEGHLLSALILQNKTKLPFIALLVSGGHTQMMIVNRIGDYHLIGETLDDAAGEAFDKTAKMMNLDLYSGSEISKLALDGDPAVFDLPKPMFNSNSLDFSFSGLKTAVMLKIRKIEKEGLLDYSTKANISASIQRSIVDILVHKVCLAIKQTGVKEVVLAGGVSSNSLLRNNMIKSVEALSGKVYFPPLEFCTDNAAMIAFAAHLRIKNKLLNINNFKKYNFSVKPRWELKDINSFYI